DRRLLGLRRRVAPPVGDTRSPAARTFRSVTVNHAVARGRATNLSFSPEAAGASADRVLFSQAQVVHFSMRCCPMFDLGPVRKWLRGSGKRRTTKPSGSSRPRPAGSRLSLETLDDRTLPGADTLTVSGG